ncbi:MAG TPA: tRNA (adenosine(37)-N6)-threonylcarbamoyltransferase complex transferase subunit TsaD [Spirochaetia bacterium]|nr:tRNA (adenosine(37)-N6)-threonylcarbamoyltransferase complex transferase subunit TsaD [Spirochaetaceae bacterium]HPE88567.1 tRNA (adenosine(37)-N6)-threonylcarbamoyltransferase complex transferase subunit TsaD [Spirochaetales bacterium]HRW24506.1 tRNA (adenosine(37)-N6)-threonylcarbamoyltransferase complex transferase subunit TsaD [Spirochaetia bacterium]
MKILGIESSCDECAAAVVEDGRLVVSSVVATQIARHAEFDGVVPEIASRLHTEWIQDVVSRAIADAGIDTGAIDGVAVTAKPGLAGSLLVGVSFAKAFAWSLGLPFVGVNHVLAHLYAPLLSEDVEYPFIGLIVSGGHTLICRADGFDDVTVLGTTIDDAIGEAFDKVAKHYGLGYPGGIAIDKLARSGDAAACDFPRPNLYKGEHRYDVSYSGLKTAAIRQLDQFWNPDYERSDANLAAAFEKAAVDMLVSRLLRALDDTGIRTVVAGGGVAANTYLRSRLAGRPGLRVLFPPLSLCGDNAAMVAGLGYRMLARGDRDGLQLNASPRVAAFKRS